MLSVHSVWWIGLTFLLVRNVSGCKVFVEGNSPLFIRNYGSKQIMFTKTNNAQIPLNVGQKINAHCSTSMSIRSHYSHEEFNFIKSIEFLCSENDKLILKPSTDHDFIDVSNNGHIYLYCKGKFKYDLYESRRNLPNCNYLSYVIGLALPNMKSIITAGICYDLDSLTLHYVNYIAYRPKYEFVTNQHTTNLQTVSLDQKLDNMDNYFSFMSQSDFNITFDIKKSNHSMLHQFDFDYMNLIQDAPMIQELNDFENMLNIMWWRNLRQGNWKLFLNALEERSKKVNYKVYTGTAGEIALPSAGSNSSDTLYVESLGITIKAPAYIWSYLKSATANVTEEFVVIGINSPYYHEASDTIFCADMCQDIDWLKYGLFDKVRLMPTMGVVFCCHPDEVAQKLSNFPVAPRAPKPVILKLESILTSTSNSLNEQ